MLDISYDAATRTLIARRDGRTVPIRDIDPGMFEILEAIAEARTVAMRAADVDTKTAAIRTGLRLALIAAELGVSVVERRPDGTITAHYHPEGCPEIVQRLDADAKRFGIAFDPHDDRRLYALRMGLAPLRLAILRLKDPLKQPPLSATERSRRRRARLRSVGLRSITIAVPEAHVASIRVLAAGLTAAPDGPFAREVQRLMSQVQEME